LRSGSGVAGVADARIQAAYQTLAEAQLPITPAKLATRALTGYPTALRWLKIHHPELLVPKAPKPEALPTEEGPKTTTRAQSSQKQPQAAPRKGGGTPKAQKLPKPLRNPKNHPELLAGDAHLATAQGSKTTRSKTLQKHPEAAPRGINHSRRKSPPNASLTPRMSLFRGHSYDR
jgi:hypothetical protein